VRRGSRLSRRTRRTTRRKGNEERRGEEEQATNIKSNNPYLAGGEIHNFKFNLSILKPNLTHFSFFKSIHKNIFSNFLGLI